MKKLLFTALFCATTFAFAGTENQTKYKADNVTYSPNGTCTMTFTAHYSDGSTQTWSESYFAFGPSDCQMLFEQRLSNLNSEC